MLLDDQGWRAVFICGFQWAPTLGGECYGFTAWRWIRDGTGFNGHPPLGVNATDSNGRFSAVPVAEFQWAPTLGGECYFAFRSGGGDGEIMFQWAPTLGGECYSIVYLITPPLCQGVNALLNISPRF